MTSSIKWADIDKPRFYCIGTGLYTVITLVLHPITVLKVRQQVADFPQQVNDLKKLDASPEIKFHERTRGLYRGIGVILSLAIPARAIYLSTLEITRDRMEELLTKLSNKAFSENVEMNERMSPLIASLSGGMAGGLAAMSSQMIIVPMDIISQHQIVMSADTYNSHGGASKISRHIFNTEGWRGFYRGFGVSIFSSLPTGSIWWATYRGCQEWVKKSENFQQFDTGTQKVISQSISGISAALTAATLTQPLDVIKTRMQVGSKQGLVSSSRELVASSGFKGFYRGLLPRVASMALWGTVLSGAYEFLRHISHKDYDLYARTSTAV